MCGIAGLVQKQGFTGERLIECMLAAIGHRGPDGRGILVDAPFVIGMTRLAIIDLEGGNQPIYNEDSSIAVVCNGEIYNFRELRRDLEKRGHRFRTDSDCEVLVHLYEEYGDEVAEHAHGMFAFAIFDAQRRQLLLARDRLGIKPLFIAETADTVVFGSEIKSILHEPSVDRSLDLQAVDEFLTYTYIPAPRTIYRGIRKVPPGSVVKITADGEVATSRYWSLSAATEANLTESEWVERVDEQLTRVVRSHLISDVPVGVFLSGGIDSSLVAAYAASESGDPVTSISVAFEDSGAAFIDERHYARQVAARHGLDHKEVVVRPDFERVAGEILSAFDEPFSDDSVIPTYYLCQATSEHLKVALSGLGGDELFAGYRRHLGLVLGEQYRWVPRPVSRYVLEPLARLLPESRESSHTVDHLKRFLRASGLPSDRRYQDSVASVPESIRDRLLTADATRAINFDETRDIIARPMRASGRDPLSAALETDINTYLVDDVLALTDRLSMWHSLEVRVPFLDHEFVEMAMTIPPDLKISKMRQKHVLREVAARHVPPEVLSHRKQGFESPMARWLRGPLKELMMDTLAGVSRHSTGLFDVQTVENLIDDHFSLRAQNSKILFSLMIFANWHERERNRRQSGG